MQCNGVQYSVGQGGVRHLEGAWDVEAEAGREGALEVVADQMSVEALSGRPCSSTSSRLLALSSCSTLLPANLHASLHVMVIRCQADSLQAQVFQCHAILAATHTKACLQVCQ